MQFEGEYLGGRVIDIASGLVDVCNAIFAKRVAKDVAIFIIAVEPKIGRGEVFVVDEFTFNL